MVKSACPSGQKCSPYLFIIYGQLDKHWIYLAIAIVAEVIGTSALKASDGFTKLYPSLVVAVSYGISFYCLSLTLRTVPVGIAYAIWSGVGVVLVGRRDGARRRERRSQCLKY